MSVNIIKTWEGSHLSLVCARGPLKCWSPTCVTGDSLHGPPDSWSPDHLCSSSLPISCSSAVWCLTGPSVRQRGWAGGRKQVCASERVVRGIVSRVSLSQMLTWEHCPVPAAGSASVNHKHSQNDNSHMTQAHGEIPLNISYYIFWTSLFDWYAFGTHSSPMIPEDTRHGTLLQIFRDHYNTERVLFVQAMSRHIQSCFICKSG